MERTLAKIASLLYIAGEQVRVIHESFADFIVNESRCYERKFLVDEVDCEQKLAACCLLSGRLIKNMYGINCKQSNKEVEDLRDRIDKFIPRSIQSDSKFWHVMSARSGFRQLLAQAERILGDQMLNWLEVVSVPAVIIEDL